MNAVFFLLALLTALSIAAIGVAIGEKSILIFIIAIVCIILFMGTGFTLKKRQRESSK